MDTGFNGIAVRLHSRISALGAIMRRTVQDGNPLHSLSSRHRLWLLFFLASLAGCQQTPEPATPSELAPERFSASGSSEVHARWWRSLDSDALEQLMQQALAGNRSLRATRARLEQARAVARREGAPRWPALTASGEATRERTDQGVTSELFSGGASASWELDLWGRVDAAADAAALDAQARAAAWSDAAITLTGEVANTWFRLREARLRETLLQNQLKLNQKVLKLIRLRRRQGQVDRADVLRQKQLVEETRGQLISTRRQNDSLRLQLAALVGTTPGQFQPPKASGDLPSAPPEPDTGVPAEVLERRPDVRQALLSVRAADERVAAALAARLPRIELGTSITDTATSAGELFQDWLASFSTSLSLPLIDGGRRRAETDRARAALRVAIHEYEQTMLDAIREVEDALSAEQRQRERLKSLRDQLGLAGQVLERIRSRYTRGTTDYLDVLDALVNKQELERRVLTARRELLQNRVTLHRTLAGGLKPRNYGPQTEKNPDE